MAENIVIKPENCIYTPYYWCDNKRKYPTLLFITMLARVTFIIGYDKIILITFTFDS